MIQRFIAYRSLHCLILSLLLHLIAAGSVSARQYSEESEFWLQRLDSTVALRDVYNEQKRDRLNQLQTQGTGLRELRDLYEHNARVYDECFTFDSELAMSLVDMNLQLSQQLHDDQGLNLWEIRRAFILASTGQLLEASKALDNIDSNKLSRPLRLQYYAQQEYLYSHLVQYSWAEWMKEEYQRKDWAYTDSIYSVLQPDDSDYLWYQAWQDYNHENYQTAIQRLQPIVDNLQLNSRTDAMLAYVLARLFERQGDRDRYLQYMSRSGIADIRAGNQDIASLEELSAVLYELSGGKEAHHFSLFGSDKESVDLARAYNYINVCIEASRRFNNVVRSVSISRVMDQIVRSYDQREALRQQRLTIITWALAILFPLLLLALYTTMRQRRRINDNRLLLQKANSDLKQANEELAQQRQALTQANSALTEANRNLVESNYVKEEYIGYVFSLCSNYISKMDEYRKNINRKAKVRLFDEILQMTDKQTLVADELKEFYQNFDAIFLHVYPQFIDEFNALLLPEERIEPRKGELLNTDLRIYALVRLGITDSVKIAEFLHCSPQTVYNNRLKIRNKAIVPKEDFVEHVRNLGRADVS